MADEETKDLLTEKSEKAKRSRMQQEAELPVRIGEAWRLSVYEQEGRQ